MGLAMIVALVTAGTASLNRLASTTDGQQVSITNAQGLVGSMTYNLAAIQVLETEAATTTEDRPLVRWEEAVGRLKRDIDALQRLDGMDFEFIDGVRALSAIVDEYQRSARVLLEGLRSRSPLTPDEVAAAMAPARPLQREVSYWLSGTALRLAESSADASAATRRERARLTRWLAAFGALAAAMSFVAAFGYARSSRRVGQNLAELQYIDVDSGLWNRRGLRRWFENAAAEARPSEPASVVIVDIDHFQLLNDTAGFTEGDRLLTEVAQQLRQSFDGLGELARVGSNRFALLVRGVQPEVVEQRVESAIKEIRVAEFDLPSGGYRTTVSAGVAHLGSAVPEFDESIATCEAALLDARTAGRDRCTVVWASDGASVTRDEIRMARRLEQVLDGDCLRLAYQRLQAVSEEAAGESWCEILLRGVDPITGSPLAPAELIGPAEHFGRIGWIDEWVVRTTLELMDRRELCDFSRVHVNLSARTITNPAFVAAIRVQLEAHPGAARRVGFELTETSVVGDTTAVNHFVEMVDEFGATVAIDDFGTGTATFAVLREIAFDTLKIDGQFIDGLESNESDQVVVQAMIDVARSFGLRSVAERVETREQADLLTSMGVDHLQGWYHHSPELLDLDSLTGRPAADRPGPL